MERFEGLSAAISRGGGQEARTRRVMSPPSFGPNHGQSGDSHRHIERPRNDRGVHDHTAGVRDAGPDLYSHGRRVKSQQTPAVVDDLERAIRIGGDNTSKSSPLKSMPSA